MMPWKDKSMGRSRRKYTAEFKREAVRMALEPGRTLVEVAGNLGIARSLLQRWKSQVEARGATAFAGNGGAKASEEELVAMRCKVALAVMLGVLGWACYKPFQESASDTSIDSLENQQRNQKAEAFFIKGSDEYWRAKAAHSEEEVRVIAGLLT
jgi:transposase